MRLEGLSPAAHGRRRQRQVGSRPVPVSPITLHEGTATALLNPEVRSLGIVTFGELERAIVSDLSVVQSLLLDWQRLVGLVAATVVIFAGAYISLMRQAVMA